MKKLFIISAVSLLSGFANAASVCIVSVYSTVVVSCDGTEVKTTPTNGNMGASVTIALKELLDKGYKIVTATDADKDSAMWTLVK